MTDPRDLATRLFGDDPGELAGWWACEVCHLRRRYPCEHDPQLWWVPAGRVVGGGS